jgi:hypothetical protein
MDSTTFTRDSSILISGDLNAHHASFTHSSYTNASGAALQTFLLSNDLAQIVTLPTRVTGTAASCLDVMITNLPEVLTFTHVLPGIGTSDHGIAVATLNVCIPDEPDPFPTTPSNAPLSFDCSHIDWVQLNDDFDNFDWNAALEADNIDEAWHNFKTIYQDTLRLHARSSNHFRNQAHTNPRPSPELLHLRSAMRTAWNINVTQHTPESHQSFIETRIQYTSAVKAKKRSHDAETIQKILEANNSKAWFRYCKKLYKGNAIRERIPTLQIDNDSISNPAIKPSALNKAFVSKASNVIHHRLPPLAIRTTKCIDWITISPEIVEKVLLHLDCSKAAGPDGIQNTILKHCSKTLNTPLSLLFNQSLMKGTLPAEWKLAEVTPVYKHKGTRSDPKNYRPISLTSSVCKTMERILNDALLNHLTSCNLIAPNQFGFLPKHSTTDQLTFLLHELHAAMNDKKSIVACFLDLAAAFDSVPHSAIIHKLPAYGVRGHLLRWIADFLHSRQQYVAIDSHHSSVESIRSGVPQGSVIAPTLFNIFMNDVSSSINASKTTLSSNNTIDSDHLIYADDTMLYCTGDNITAITSQMNDALKAIDNWATTWGMTFNHSKTSALFISRTRLPQDIFFANHRIEYVSSHKHLGFTISNDLRLTPHIDSICRKASSEIFLLKRLSTICTNQDILTRTYKSFILPLFEYASPAWSTLSITDTNRLEALQRRAIRIILSQPYTRPLTEIDYSAASITPLQHRRNFATLCYGYKLLNRHLPPKLNKLIPITHRHHYAIRSSRLFIPPASVTPPLRIFDRSPLCFAVKLLNSIPEPLRTTATLQEFKTSINSLPHVLLVTP